MIVSFQENRGSCVAVPPGGAGILARASSVSDSYDPRGGRGGWEQAQSSPQGPGDETCSGRGKASLRPEVQLHTDIQILEIRLHWRWHLLGQGQRMWP